MIWFKNLYIIAYDVLLSHSSCLSFIYCDSPCVHPPTLIELRELKVTFNWIFHVILQCVLQNAI